MSDSFNLMRSTLISFFFDLPNESSNDKAEELISKSSPLVKNLFSPIETLYLSVFALKSVILEQSLLSI